MSMENDSELNGIGYFLPDGIADDSPPRRIGPSNQFQNPYRHRSRTTEYHGSKIGPSSRRNSPPSVLTNTSVSSTPSLSPGGSLLSGLGGVVHQPYQSALPSNSTIGSYDPLSSGNYYSSNPGKIGSSLRSSSSLSPSLNPSSVMDSTDRGRSAGSLIQPPRGNMSSIGFPSRNSTLYEFGNSNLPSPSWMDQDLNSPNYGVSSNSFMMKSSLLSPNRMDCVQEPSELDRNSEILPRHHRGSIDGMDGSDNLGSFRGSPGQLHPSDPSVIGSSRYQSRIGTSISSTSPNAGKISPVLERLNVTSAGNGHLTYRSPNHQANSDQSHEIVSPSSRSIERGSSKHKSTPRQRNINPSKRKGLAKKDISQQQNDQAQIPNERSETDGRSSVGASGVRKNVTTPRGTTSVKSNNQSCGNAQVRQRLKSPANQRSVDRTPRNSCGMHDGSRRRFDERKQVYREKHPRESTTCRSRKTDYVPVKQNTEPKEVERQIAPDIDAIEIDNVEEDSSQKSVENSLNKQDNQNMKNSTKSQNTQKHMDSGMNGSIIKESTSNENNEIEGSVSKSTDKNMNTTKDIVNPATMETTKSIERTKKDVLKLESSAETQSSIQDEVSRKEKGSKNKRDKERKEKEERERKSGSVSKVKREKDKNSKNENPLSNSPVSNANVSSTVSTTITSESLEQPNKNSNAIYEMFQSKWASFLSMFELVSIGSLISKYTSSLIGLTGLFLQFLFHWIAQGIHGMIKLHNQAIRVLSMNHHVAFCFSFMYAFPFLVQYIIPWAPPWAPVCLWYAFLVQLFCTHGPTAMVATFRLLLPLMFLLEGVSHHSFLLDLNGAELLLISFILSAIKSRNLLSPIFFVSLATQCLSAVFVGSNLITQWWQLTVALVSLHAMNGNDEDDSFSFASDISCDSTSSHPLSHSISDYHPTIPSATSIRRTKRLDRRSLANAKSRKLR